VRENEGEAESGRERDRGETAEITRCCRIEVMECGARGWRDEGQRAVARSTPQTEARSCQGMNPAPTHEDVRRIWAMPSDLEQLHEVKELSMYISAYLRAGSVAQLPVAEVVVASSL
jgi:hypothetical protein